MPLANIYWAVYIHSLFICAIGVLYIWFICEFVANSLHICCICCLCVFVRAIPPRDLSPFLCIIGVFAPQSSLHFAASKTMSLISTYLPKPCHWFPHFFQTHAMGHGIDFRISPKTIWLISTISAFQTVPTSELSWKSSIVHDDKYLFYFLSSVCSGFFRIAEHKYAEVFLYALPLYPVAQQYGAFLLSCLAFPHASCPALAA